jgi:hypothetical protein
MSYADLPPNACYVPELHLRVYWLVRGYGDDNIVMTDLEFSEFIDRVKYDGIEYTAERIQMTPETFSALAEARL